MSTEDTDELRTDDVSSWGAVRPIMSIVSAALPHALDVEIPDHVAFVLVAKGWIPPELDRYCPRKISAPIEHLFTTYTHTCLYCGAHEKATTP